MGQTLISGQCPVKEVQPATRDLIASGKANRDWIISQELPREGAVYAQKQCDEPSKDWTKVISSRLSQTTEGDTHDQRP